MQTQEIWTPFVPGPITIDAPPEVSVVRAWEAGLYGRAYAETWSDDSDGSRDANAPYPIKATSCSVSTGIRRSGRLVGANDERVHDWHDDFYGKAPDFEAWQTKGVRAGLADFAVRYLGRLAR